jgi:hypothetical protein
MRLAAGRDPLVLISEQLQQDDPVDSLSWYSEQRPTTPPQRRRDFQRHSVQEIYSELFAQRPSYRTGLSSRSEGKKYAYKNPVRPASIPLQSSNLVHTHPFTVAP